LDEEVELLDGVVVLLRAIESHRLLPYLHHHYLVVLCGRPPGRSHQQVFSSNSNSSSILVRCSLVCFSFLLDVVFDVLSLSLTVFFSKFLHSLLGFTRDFYGDISTREKEVR